MHCTRAIIFFIGCYSAYAAPTEFPLTENGKPMEIETTTLKTIPDDNVSTITTVGSIEVSTTTAEDLTTSGAILESSTTREDIELHNITSPTTTVQTTTVEARTEVEEELIIPKHFFYLGEDDEDEVKLKANDPSLDEENNETLMPGSDDSVESSEGSTAKPEEVMGKTEALVMESGATTTVKATQSTTTLVSPTTTDDGLHETKTVSTSPTSSQTTTINSVTTETTQSSTLSSEVKESTLTTTTEEVDSNNNEMNNEETVEMEKPTTTIKNIASVNGNEVSEDNVEMHKLVSESESESVSDNTDEGLTEIDNENDNVELVPTNKVENLSLQTSQETEKNTIDAIKPDEDVAYDDPETAESDINEKSEELIAIEGNEKNAETMAAVQNPPEEEKHMDSELEKEMPDETTKKIEDTTSIKVEKEPETSTEIVSETTENTKSEKEALEIASKEGEIKVETAVSNSSEDNNKNGDTSEVHQTVMDNSEISNPEIKDVVEVSNDTDVELTPLVVAHDLMEEAVEEKIQSSTLGEKLLEEDTMNKIKESVENSSESSTEIENETNESEELEKSSDMNKDVEKTEMLESSAKQISEEPKKPEIKNDEELLEMSNEEEHPKAESENSEEQTISESEEKKLSGLKLEQSNEKTAEPNVNHDDNFSETTSGEEVNEQNKKVNEKLSSDSEENIEEMSGDSEDIEDGLEDEISERILTENESSEAVEKDEMDDVKVATESLKENSMDDDEPVMHSSTMKHEDLETTPSIKDTGIKMQEDEASEEKIKNQEIEEVMKMTENEKIEDEMTKNEKIIEEIMKNEKMEEIDVGKEVIMNEEKENVQGTEKTESEEKKDKMPKETEMENEEEKIVTEEGKTENKQESIENKEEKTVTEKETETVEEKTEIEEGKSDNDEEKTEMEEHIENEEKTEMEGHIENKEILKESEELIEDKAEKLNDNEEESENEQAEKKEVKIENQKSEKVEEEIENLKSEKEEGEIENLKSEKEEEEIENPKSEKEEAEIENPKSEKEEAEIENPKSEKEEEIENENIEDSMQIKNAEFVPYEEEGDDGLTQKRLKPLVPSSENEKLIKASEVSNGDKVLSPRLVKEPVRIQQFSPGEPFVLLCSSEEDSALYSWTKNGRFLNYDESVFRESTSDGNLLFIKPKMKDSGTYQCVVESSETGRKTFSSSALVVPKMFDKDSDKNADQLEQDYNEFLFKRNQEDLEKQRRQSRQRSPSNKVYIVYPEEPFQESVEVIDMVSGA